MSFSNDLRLGSSMFLDPANIFGTRGQEGPGSRIEKQQGNFDPSGFIPEGYVFNPADPTHPMRDPAAFMANITPSQWGSGEAFGRQATAAADPANFAPPPPQWAFVNGQGPVWQTPDKRMDGNNNWSMTSNAPGTPGFYKGGNRI